MTAAQDKSSRNVEAKDYELIVPYEMKSFGTVADPWIFTDHAPVVFYHIRHSFQVQASTYLVMNERIDFM